LCIVSRDKVWSSTPGWTKIPYKHELNFSFQVHLFEGDLI
jgi:hypothetical protein